MLTPRDSFMLAIRDSPADMDLRDVFADWLAEHGAPGESERYRARTEVIRLAQLSRKTVWTSLGLIHPCPRCGSRNVDDSSQSYDCGTCGYSW